MSKRKYVLEDFVPEKAFENSNMEFDKLLKRKEINNLMKVYKSLYNVYYYDNVSSLHDHRINCFIWASDIMRLIHQIMHGYCWMVGYEKFFESLDEPQGDFYISYYADNCIIRINSCRDKLSLMVWAYYRHFNPEYREEVLDYWKIMDRLKKPQKLALHLPGVAEFLEKLVSLESGCWDQIKKYRDFKIHRLEPIIIADFIIQSRFLYLAPVRDEKEVAKRKAKVLENTSHWRKSDREELWNECLINGVYSSPEKITNQEWEYAVIKKAINDSMMSVVSAADGCFRILRRRKPFRK